MSRRSKNLLLVGVLVVAAGLAAALIAVSVTGAKDEPAAGAVHGVEATEALLQGIPQNGNVLGKPDAPVTIVEYADYQCPYCARWALDTLPAIVDEYVRPGKVQIVFQGIAILGEDSVTALQTAVVRRHAGQAAGTSASCCSTTRAPRTPAGSPTTSCGTSAPRCRGSTSTR